MNDTLLTLTILKSLALNYPILAERGYVLTRLLVIHIEKNQTKQAADILVGFEPTVVSEFLRLKDIAEKLQECNSEYCIFPYSSTRKGQEIVKFLESVVKVNCIDEKKLRGLPLIITEERIKGNMDNLFQIHLAGDLSGIVIDTEEVVPSDEQLAVVFDKVTDIDMIGKTQEEKALLAAACFTYPSLKEMGCIEKFQKLLACASRLVEYDENNRDLNDIDKIFLNELYAWQEKNSFQDIFILPRLEMNVESRMESIMLYNEEYLYFTEALFIKILEPLLSMFSLNVIKQALADCNVMHHATGATYTVKVNYYNIVGEYKRIRMLRFNRERLCRLGELDFVELCLNEKGESEDEN